MQHYLALAIFALGFWVPALGWAQAPDSDKARQKAIADLEGLQKKKSGLEDQIAEALKNNPDIRVAEARLREADAELHRIRLKVSAELAALHADIQADQATVAEVESQYERSKEMQKRTPGAISAYDMQIAKLTLLRHKGDLAAKLAKVPYLLGRQTAGSSAATHLNELIKKKLADAKQDSTISDVEFLRRVMVDVLGRLPTVDESKKFLDLPEKERRKLWLDHVLDTNRAGLHVWMDMDGCPAVRHAGNMDCARCHDHPMRIGQLMDTRHQRLWVEQFWSLYFKTDSPMTDKLRKALDAPMSVKVELNSTKEIVDLVRKHLPGVNVHDRTPKPRPGSLFPPPPEPRTSAAFAEPIATGAFLQFLEDDLHWVFVVRDYGVIILSADERLPPGATRVTDFWKHGKAEQRPQKGGPDEKSK